MVIGRDELERIADEMYLQRGISDSVYCGNCGYNLRTLPYIYRCPECGNRYNARPLKRTGIFDPYEIEPPIGDIAATVFCTLLAALLVIPALKPLSQGRLLFGSLFVLLKVYFGFKAYWRLKRFLKANAIARRIRMEESE